VSAPPSMAGLPGRDGHHGPELGRDTERALSACWPSDERIAETRRVWSRAYGRVIGKDEAIEILRNIRRLAEALIRGEVGNRGP
jgi:hypothetical protein